MQCLLVATLTLAVVTISSAVPQTLFPGFHLHRLNEVHPYKYIPVISRTEVHDDAGQFALNYRTGDGQEYTEQGALKKTLTGNDYVLVKTGSYSYISPEGTPIKVSYVADENGYRPVGEHLPTPVSGLPTTL